MYPIYVCICIYIYHILYIYIICIHYPFNLLIFPSPFFPSFPVPSHASAIKLTWPGPATVEKGHRSFKNVGTSGAEFCQVCGFFPKRWLTLKRRVVLFFSHHWCPKGSPGWMCVFFGYSILYGRLVNISGFKATPNFVGSFADVVVTFVTFESLRTLRWVPKLVL